MRLWIALLAIPQAPPVLSFVHPVQCSLGSTRVRNDVGTVVSSIARTHELRMVATAPSLSKTEVDGTNGEEPLSAGFTVVERPNKELRVVEMYDTTLRDGTQMEGISASVNDKLKIAKELHNFGET